jgi:hypothetical protein
MNHAIRILGVTMGPDQQRPTQTVLAMEGPFVIGEVLRLGTYKLKDEKGRTLANGWNIEQPRWFYP